MTSNTVSSSGLACSVLASVLFGIVPWYVQLLGMEGNLLFWNRISFTTVTIVAILWLQRRWPEVRTIFQSPRTMVYLGLGAVIIGIQWWLFVWAPVNGQTKELSLGYFLLPLTLALTGRLVYKETIRPLQKLAIVFAGIGVLAEIHQQGSLPWVAITVAGLYPFYFMLRRKVDVAPLPGMFFENLLFFPIALFILLTDTHFHNLLNTSGDLMFLLPGLGILCGSSMLFYIAASRKLPVSLFGLLGYLEPAVIFLVAILILREPFNAEQMLTYGFIWLAATITSFDSIRLVRASAAT